MKPANTNQVPGSGTLDDVPKDVVVRLRLTADERERWQAAADAAQRTLSDWMRVVANAAATSTTIAKPRQKRRGVRS